MTVLDACPRGLNESVEPQCKKFPIFIVNPKADEFRWMEGELSFFDAGNDEVTGVRTTLKLAGELEEIFEVLNCIFFRGATTT